MVLETKSSLDSLRRKRLILMVKDGDGGQDDDGLDYHDYNSIMDGDDHQDDDITTTISACIPHLPRHDLAIDATDIDSSIETSLVMGIHNVTPESLVSPRSAIIRTLSNFGNKKCLIFNS